jgi:hypothetical protein
VATTSDIASVFHYTDMASLLGVVSGGELWATETSGMNDPAELDGGLLRIREWLESHRSDDTARQILDHVLPPDHALLTGGAFVFSASLDYDDASQWRLYGADGDGCCIELDTGPQLSVRTTERLAQERGLKRDTGLPKDAEADQRPRFRQGFLNHATVTRWLVASYDDNDVESALKSMLGDAFSEFAAAESAAADYDDAWVDAKERVLNRILRVAGTFKGATWKHEREARVIARLDEYSRHSSFRASRYGLVRYVRLSHHLQGLKFPVARKGKWRVPIKSVTLGPRQNFQLAAPAVKELLRRCDYRAVIEGETRDDFREGDATDLVLVRRSEALLR